MIHGGQVEDALKDAAREEGIGSAHREVMEDCGSATLNMGVLAVGRERLGDRGPFKGALYGAKRSGVTWCDNMVVY